MKRARKKLALHRQTVRVLSDTALTAVVGGGTQYICLPNVPTFPPQHRSLSCAGLPCVGC